jgi:hypothetical protein
VLCFVAAVGGAAENASQTFQVKIGAILASNQSDSFDARLAPLEKQLRLMKYRSYRLLKEESQKVQRKGNATFAIPGGRSLVVTPQESGTRQIALRVHLQQGGKPLIDTTVRLDGGSNFLLGGPPHEGGALVISISATAQ